jgi:hypothetical protein
MVRFQGTTPPEVLSMLAEQVSGWDVDELWVGCSGNFTIERALASLGLPIHSNDVTLYSTFVGHWLEGDTKFAPELSRKALWFFPYAADYQGTMVDRVATGLMLAGYADFTKNKNPYYERMLDAVADQWEKLHFKQVEKLEAMSTRLASYSCEDVTTWVERMPERAGFISFPPFWSDGYDKMFEQFATLYDWEQPEFEDVAPQTSSGEATGNAPKLLQTVMEQDHWLLMSNERHEDLEEYLFARAATTSLAVPIWGYVYPPQHRHSRNFNDKSVYEDVLMRRLVSGEEIGDRLWLTELNPAQFRSLRAQYMDMRIPPAQSFDQCFGVVVGERLIGAFATGGAAPGANTSGTNEAYILSDFSVGPTDYKHLSKLVLCAIQSREFKAIAERRVSHQVREVYTSAFTDNPTSMKYRGVFQLHKRMELKGAAHKYCLQYKTEAGRWSLDEAFDYWRRKWAKR